MAMNQAPQRPTVFLFDIDGTLLLTGGAGRRAVEAAFALHTGRADACSGFSFGGMTDRAIVRAGLLAVGAAVTDVLIDAVIASYLTHLEAELGQSTGYQVMPGVHETIAALRIHAHCAIGLGTGNVRGGAQLKLRRGELWEHFDFGGFGCDDEDRTALLRVGAARGAARLGAELGDCRVVVIGDTLRDVAAAQGMAAECLAVETGGVSGAVLLGAGAHAAVRNLSKPAALEFLLKGP